MASELIRVIEQVEKEKGIQKEVLIEALESAMLMAAKKRFGLEREIEAQYNTELGEVELFEFKTVSEKVRDDRTQISLNDAQELDPEVVMGDSIGVKLDNSEFGRIAAQTAKQVIIQKVRDAERDLIYNEFNVRKGEVVSGVCRRIEKGCLIIDLGRTDAILPAREQIPGEHYRPGDRVLGYLIDVQQTPRGPKIVLSRTCPDLLVQLFHQEVPEVAEGIVQIKSAAREPGVRAKIAVDSKDPDVDPVGACVGVKGVRVQNVVQELRGEKIDIVPWDEEDSRFVCNALAPAEVQKVLLDEENRSMEIVVADNQLSLAIGKRGQNVKLASMLTGWKIDIVSESKMEVRLEQGKALLKKIAGIEETMAKTLYHFGFELEVLAETEPAALKAIPGLSDEKAAALVQGAKDVVSAPDFEKTKAEIIAALTPAPSDKPGTAAPSAAAPQKKLSADELFAKLKAEVKAQESKDDETTTTEENKEESAPVEAAKTEEASPPASNEEETKVEAAQAEEKTPEASEQNQAQEDKSAEDNGDTK